MKPKPLSNSKKKLCLLAAILSVTLISAQNKTYYVSSAGNDLNSGLATTAAWQTTSKVNTVSFQPGDQILFEGGQTFSGFLRFGSDDIGTPLDPLVVSSFGTGKATINSGSVNGLYAYNVGEITIQNLIFKGSGSTSNEASGVEFYMDQTTADLQHVAVNNVEAFGFGGKGILLGSYYTTKGYRNVRITNCTAHNNGFSGIETYGFYPQISHFNVYVGYCKAYQNDGRSDYTANHSGSGIILSGVDGAVIEYCEAYENGRNNGHLNGGPVGIWFYLVKNGVIQFCESHHNKAGLDADGGGFDLDGGSQNCIIQYCYSHENEGPGYALFEYGSGLPFVNNVIRYNISQNDGRKNSYGGIMFWAANAAEKITNSEVYNNTIYVNGVGVVNGIPSAVGVLNNNLSQIHLRNNIFYVTGGANLIKAPTAPGNAALLFQNNNYYAEGVGNFIWGTNTYLTLNAWKAALPGQETMGASSLGSILNPLLVNAGAGGTIGPATGGNLTALTNYKLHGASPLINTGLNLVSSFSINPGARDFYNTVTSLDGAYDVGANEFGDIVLPVSFIAMGGKLSENYLNINWAVNSTGPIESATIETSTDRKYFIALKEYKKPDVSNQRQFIENIAGNYPDVLFSRVKVVELTGEVLYSKIIRLQKNQLQTLLTLYPIPARDKVFLTSNAPFTSSRILLRNTAGQIVLQQPIADGVTQVSIDLTGLSGGIYFGTLLSNNSAFKEQFKVLKQ